MATTTKPLPARGQIWRFRHRTKQRVIEIVEIKNRFVTNVNDIGEEPIGSFRPIAFETLWERWDLVTDRSTLMPRDVDVSHRSAPGLCEMVRGGVYLPRWKSQRETGRVIQVLDFDKKYIYNKRELGPVEKTNKKLSLADFRLRYELVARSYDEWCDYPIHNQPPSAREAKPAPAVKMVKPPRRKHASLEDQLAQLDDLDQLRLLAKMQARLEAKLKAARPRKTSGTHARETPRAPRVAGTK